MIDYKWNEINKIFLIEEFNSYYKDKGYYSDRKKIIIILNNNKILQDTYYPAKQIKIHNTLIDIAPNGVEIICAEKKMGAESLN